MRWFTTQRGSMRANFTATSTATRLLPATVLHSKSMSRIWNIQTVGPIGSLPPPIRVPNSKSSIRRKSGESHDSPDFAHARHLYREIALRLLSAHQET